MKLKRKNGLTVGIITLSAVALTSVGFAAWVISAGDTASLTGDIQVDSVSDDSHTIVGVYEKTLLTDTGTSIKGSTSTQTIKFGAPRNTSADAEELSSKWLSTDNTTNYESLKATFYVNVLNGSVDEDSLIPSFLESETYLVNTLVTHENTIYKCKTAIDVAGEWDSSKWEEFVPDNFSASSTYAVDTYVKHGGEIYKCTTAVSSAGAFNSNNWLVQIPATEFVKAGFEVVEPETKKSLAGSGYSGLTSYTNGFASAVALNLVKTQKVEIATVKSTDATTLDTNSSFSSTEYNGKEHTWFKVDISFEWGSLFDLSVSTEFTAATAYAINTLVKKDGAIYRAKEAHAAEAAWDDTKWTLIKPADFSTGNTYNVGKYVVYKNTIYKCKTAVSTAGAWDETKWDSLGAVNNPYVYYNAFLSNKELEDPHYDTGYSAEHKPAASYLAKKYLSSLDTLLDEATYKFEFRSYANAAEKNDDFVTSTPTKVVTA